MTIRDRGLPLPAGGILISPWVDLSHSFPSIISENPGDYLPQNGFHFRPSSVWPPPNADEIGIIKREGHEKKSSERDIEKAVPQQGSRSEQTAVQGYTVSQPGESIDPIQGQHVSEQTADHLTEQAQSDPSAHARLETVAVEVDNQTVEIKDQIQMYTTNQLLRHPLVSPVLQPSLGGLPPLFILCGGGEMLRDEQFYLAHKAANPGAYAPNDASLDEHDPNREVLNKYPPTYVQLQVWDDLCHVAPTLSWTRPAKYMYRAIAQFGAWALAKAQNSPIDIVDDDAGLQGDSLHPSFESSTTNPPSVGRAGDPLPPFHKYMIRQRVDRNGRIYPLDPPRSYPVLQIDPSTIGVMNPVLVKRWVAAKRVLDRKYAKDKLRVQRERIRELGHGFQDFNGESPPPSSLASRRAALGVLPVSHSKKNYPMFLWSKYAVKDVKKKLGREVEPEARRSQSVDARNTGDTRLSMSQGTLDPEERQQNPTYQTPFVSEGEQASSGGPNGVAATQPVEPGPSQTRSLHAQKPSAEKPLSPLLVLPNEDVKNSMEENENASTRTLFHAQGTIPGASKVTLPAPRPGSRPTSWTVRSQSDDASTVGDNASLAATNANVDAASTRAVLDAKGVVDAVDRPNTPSTITHTRSMSAAGIPPPDGVNDASDSAADARPGMPDREVFRTADQYHDEK